MRSMYSLIVVAVFSLLLSACGSEEAEKGMTSQVIAKVNGVEITVTELNEYLKRVPVQTQDENAIEQVKKSVLNSLIDQKLLIQAAEGSQVDRSADVLAAIDIAKNKIIVDSYLNKVLGNTAEPTDRELRNFYTENTKLFSDRKRFIYDVYSVVTGTDNVQSIAEQIKPLQKASELKGFFEEAGIEYKVKEEDRTSNQLPAELVKAMNVLKSGDIGYFKVSDGLVVIALKQAEPIPVSYEQAKGAVALQLQKQDRAESVKKMIKSLKQNASVEFNPQYENLKNVEPQ